MSTANPLDVLKKADSLKGRLRLRREADVGEANGKRVVRHTRPEQVLFRTTADKKHQLDRLAELSGRAKAEVLEAALDLYEAALLDEMKEEGRRK